MLLTITTTHRPATDIGYLLHKHPDSVNSFDLTFGQAHVFYPEATQTKCTAALLLDIDPIGLVRKDKGNAFPLEQYVNDRPYVASSFMSVAINRVFGTLLAGKCQQRPALVAQPIPLKAEITVLPCREGEDLLKALFEPLGYKVKTKGYPLDAKYRTLGKSPYYQVTLTQTCPLKDLLTHLYVLMPVLDNHKHYFIGEDEIEKLLQNGQGWLQTHPQRELITKRYLKNFRSLTRRALDRLREDDPVPDDAIDEQAKADEAEAQLEETASPQKTVSLHKQRLQAVIEMLQQHQVASVLDLGCGEGKLLRLLQKEKGFERIAGCDVSSRSLEIARDRLKLNRLHQKQTQSITIFQSGLTYCDARFHGFDALVLVEVIEHIEPTRLSALEYAVFDDSKPRIVIVTTPNREYNRLFTTLPPGQLRHADHRFEWTRQEFMDWANQVAERNKYAVSFYPIGELDAQQGAPSQMAVFVQPEPEEKPT